MLLASDEDFKKFIELDAGQWEIHFESLKEKFSIEKMRENPNSSDEGIRMNFQLQFKNREIFSVNFDGRAFKNISFDETTFKDCSLKKCTFEKGQFGRCNFIDVKLSESTFTDFPINIQCSGKNDFSNIKSKQSLQGDFSGVNLRKADLSFAGLHTCMLVNTDLRGAIFSNANLTNTNWKFAKIDRFTRLDNAVFEAGSSKHPVTRDNSEHIKFSWLGRRWLNWMVVRSVGSFPLFGFSWGVFIFALLVVNTIGFLNEHTNPAVIDGLNHIPVPDSMISAIISSLLLAIGSTLYKLRCPERIQEFSVTEWVYEHGHPRVEYILEALQRPISLFFTVLCLLIGGYLGFQLVILRVVQALSYIAT